MTTGAAPESPDSLVEVRGARIAYTDAGRGPFTVYAHGLTQSRRSETASGMFDWSPVVESGRRLVRYDARGHGRSTGDAVPEQYTWPQLAEDLLALLDELAGPEPVCGIGSSMGTATLVHAAVLRPDRFERLVLTAPPTAWATRAGQGGAYRGIADLVEQRGSTDFSDLAAQMPVPPVFADLPGYPPAPDVSLELLPSVMRGAAASDLPAEDLIAEIQVPVLILPWAGDPGHPLSTAEKLNSLIKDSSVRVASTGAELREWGRLSAAFFSPS